MSKRKTETLAVYDVNTYKRADTTVTARHIDFCCWLLFSFCLYLFCSLNLSISQSLIPLIILFHFFVILTHYLSIVHNFAVDDYFIIAWLWNPFTIIWFVLVNNLTVYIINSSRIVPQFTELEYVSTMNFVSIFCYNFCFNPFYVSIANFFLWFFSWIHFFITLEN